MGAIREMRGFECEPGGIRKAYPKIPMVRGEGGLLEKEPSSVLARHPTERHAIAAGKAAFADSVSMFQRPYMRLTEVNNVFLFFLSLSSRSLLEFQWLIGFAFEFSTFIQHFNTAVILA